MASIIRIKRSGTSGNPSVLGQGEFAYSSLPNDDINGGDRLYIGVGTETAGNAADHVVVGGKYFTDLLDHTRGTLQPSSALITDSSSKIDQLNVDNLNLNGNTLSSTDVNGNIYIMPNGSGSTQIKNLVVTGDIGSSNLTQGRVVFVGASSVLDDDNSFLWDDTNKQLNITGAAKVDYIKLDGNTISTTNDNGNLIIRPITVNSDTTASQAVVKIDNVRGLVIPVGTSAQRPASPDQGLIRYNTTISQFEGYNGTSYISIGGVRDVDGNTYIVPELSPGSNENTLFFYTDGVERATLSTSEFNVNTSITSIFKATTASTTTTTGAVQVVGGVGIGGQLNVGGATNKFTASTASSSSTTGAVVVTGGVGIGGNLNVAGNTAITGTLTVASDGAPQAVSIEASTLNLQAQQNASLGVSTNSASTYTLTIDALNSGVGGANLDVNVESDFTLDATSVSIDSTDSSNLTMTANSSSTKTLTIDATNSGTGAAAIVIGSSDTDTVTVNANASSGVVDVNAAQITVDVPNVDVNASTVDIVTTGGGDGVTVTTGTTNINSNTINIIGKNGSADATVNVTGIFNADNLRIDGNTISTTDGSNTLYLDPAPVNDVGGTVVIKGNLQVDGTTTTINSTQVTIDDPIFVLGGDATPASDDNLDRGIEFQWHNGSAAKLGFFGFDDSANEFIFIPDATDTSGVISGTNGNAALGKLRLTDTTASTTTTTGAFTVAGGAGIAGQLNVGGATNKFTASTNSTSTTSGALVVTGGVGIGQTMYIGDDIVGSGAGTLASPGSVIDGFMIDGGTY
jgi:hypothetical protein